MNNSEIFSLVVSQLREIASLEATRGLLEWDERTGLPSRAGAYRAEQITLLSGLLHRRRTDPALGEQLDALNESELAQNVNSPEGATIYRLRKDFQRNSKLPVELVQAISKATVLGQQAWEQARKEDNWQAFRPHMQQLFDLRRQEAEHVREDGCLYDALLDQYEDGARSVALTQVFAGLRDDLVQLVQALAEAPARPDGATWKRAVAVHDQRQVSHWIAEQIGYDFTRGRLDVTSHPFCTTLGPHDCRILTRYQADFFPSGFYGTLHEAGHGLYEQGLPSEWYGLPPGMHASLGVHESQSRMWENFVGRSRAFWQWCLPRVSPMVGGAWHGIDAEAAFRDANLVQPSLIRVEADEVTYNLHILIRFEIEQELMSGELSVADAPQAWNQRYEHYLGVPPPSDKDGILQDVHWSAGLIGYFPTYTLGNLYAAQLMIAAEAALGPLDELFSRGDFRPLLDWLRTNVHAHGFCYHPGKLIEKATGQSLSATPLVAYLRQKLEPIYGL